MLIALSVSGQSYRPVWIGMERAFAETSGPGRMYSLVLDSVQISGTDTTWFNYFNFNDSVSHFSGCGYLGGDECNQLNRPSWTGRGIRPMSNGNVQFHNSVGETLDFLLPETATDTGWFYADGEQRFGLMLIGSDTVNLLGVLDSARFYQVVHVDLQGSIINSSLHEAPFTICKSLGLVEFFQVDSFPAVLRRLRMIGDAEQQIGLHIITDASIHDYQIGDEVQYSHFEYSALPEMHSGYHLKETILSRAETDTTVIYSLEFELFQEGSTQMSSGLNTRVYSKTDTVAKIPFESFSGVVRSMYQVDHCGSLLWHYDFDPDNRWYTCPYGPCWTAPVNGYGPNPVSSAYHIIGVGSGHDFSQHFLPEPWGGLQYVSHSTYITYFAKNGIPCGTATSVDISETSKENGITISPIPSNGQFMVRANSAIQRVDVFDPQGRSISGVGARGTNMELDLGDRPDGMYAVHVLFQNGSRVNRMVMIAH